MPLRLDGKKAIVAEVSAVAQKAVSVVAAEYSGLTVAQLTELRARAREASISVRVVRNNLARLAFAGTSFSCMDPVLVGPLVLAFSLEEPSAAARIFRDYSKKWDKLQVKALSIEGQLYGAQDLDRVANLPTRLEAIARLMSVMQGPITKLVRTMAEPHAKLVRTLAAVRDSKQSAS